MKRLLALGLAAICLACALPLTACTPQQKLYSAMHQTHLKVRPEAQEKLQNKHRHSVAS